MLWDDRYLYIAAELQEPDVWANLRQRDTIVYYNNDFEVFIDPDGDGHHYYEIEVKALCTVFDLFLEKPYRAPRRPHVQFQWNCPGLRIATHVDGTLNLPGDTDRGWSVEMAIPREAIAAEFDNYLQAGNYLRIGFSRVQWQHSTDKDGRYHRKQRADGTFLPEDTGRGELRVKWPCTCPNDGDTCISLPSPQAAPLRKLSAIRTHIP